MHKGPCRAGTISIPSLSVLKAMSVEFGILLRKKKKPCRVPELVPIEHAGAHECASQNHVHLCMRHLLDDLMHNNIIRLCSTVLHCVPGLRARRRQRLARTCLAGTGPTAPEQSGPGQAASLPHSQSRPPAHPRHHARCLPPGPLLQRACALARGDSGHERPGRGGVYALDTPQLHSPVCRHCTMTHTVTQHASGLLSIGAAQP